MDIVVKGRHCEVRERFRTHVADKLVRLEKYDGKLIRIDVEVSHENNPRQSDQAERVEITVTTKGPVIRAEAAATDKYAALDLAADKLFARLRKAADRRRVHHGQHAPQSLRTSTPERASMNGVATTSLIDELRGEDEARAAVDAASVIEYLEAESEAEQQASRMQGGVRVDGDGPLLVREKTHTASPITLEQALYEMELVGHDFYLFVDADSKAPSVVYRRKGYDYGVIHLST